MKSMKVVAFLAFLLNTILFATYYAIAKEALERIDPIMFTFFEIATLAPAGLCIILLTWKAIRWSIIKQGFLLGSCLSLALFTIAIALKYTTATGTAFFPALNGFLAALIAWVFLRQPVTKATWCAGLLSTIGVTLLIMNSPMGGIRGVLIAFLGGLFFTGYVFLSDHHPQDAHPSLQTKMMPPAKDHRQTINVELTLFGIELLTMAVWACLIALLFGDWEAIHMSLPKDGLVIFYVAGACTFLPTLLTVFMQKHTSPVTVSFIYILEPVFSAIIAMLYLHEMLPLNGYLGGILVVAGAIIHTSGTLWQKRASSTKAETAIAGIMPSISLARSAHSTHPAFSAPPSAETTKLLGLRLTSSTSMAASPATFAAHTAAYVHPGSPVFTTTEPLPAHLRRTHIARIPSTPSTPGAAATHHGRSSYAMGAIEWIDEDICERPTRPVLDARPARATRDLSIWLTTNLANQPIETLPTTQKSRVRTTEDLRELSLPMRPPTRHPTHTPIPPTDAREQMPQYAKFAGKGPVWLEEDGNATNIASMFSQSTIAHNYQEQPVERVELAEFLD